MLSNTWFCKKLKTRLLDGCFPWCYQAPLVSANWIVVQWEGLAYKVGEDGPMVVVVVKE